VAVLAKAFARDDNPEKRLELTEHLAELRSRILRSIVYLAAGAILCYFYFKPLYRFLFYPMERVISGQNEWKIVFMQFTQPFFVVLQISVVAGFIVAAPLITMEAWAFISPALTREEKRPLRYVAPLGVALFFGGVSLAYWVAQFAIGWFTSYINWFPRAVLYQDPKAYVLFMLKMMGVFGLIFQLPVVLMFLAWVGLLTSKMMKATWRHAIVGISVVGLMITPSNDLFTMFMMIIPVIVLYLGSIWLVQLVERKRARQAR